MGGGDRVRNRAQRKRYAVAIIIRTVIVHVGVYNVYYEQPMRRNYTLFILKEMV